jgi:hypothetical protein
MQALHHDHDGAMDFVVEPRQQKTAAPWPIFSSPGLI